MSESWSVETFTEDYTVGCRPNLIALAFDDDDDVNLNVRGVRVTAASATPPLPGGAWRQRFGALLFGSL
jgi:hypothetical protein